MEEKETYIVFRTYNEALVWNLFESVIVIFFICAVICFIDAELGFIITLLGMFFMFSNYCRYFAMYDPFGRNCLYDPEKDGP